MSRRRPAPDGGDIGYRVLGDSGRWLVLIHGWCGGAEHWALVAPNLARAARVLVVTLPGFGGMAAAPAAGRTIAALGAAVADLLVAVDVSDAVLIGHSMGGPVAVEAALAAPERVGALLGLDTLSDRGYYGRVPEAEIRRRRAEMAADYAGGMRAMVDRIVHPTTDAVLRARITAGLLASAAPDVALDVKDSLFAWDVAARWPLLTCRAMLLNSTHVAALADPDALPCLAATPIVPYDSGHFPMLESPSMIVEKIGHCIDGLVY